MNASLPPVRMAMLSNPQSGWNRKHLPRLSRLAESSGVPHVVCPYDALPQHLPDVMAKAPELLIVNGGDGTVDGVIAWFRGQVLAPPILAVLGGGTTNMLRGDVGFRGPPDRALMRLLGLCRDGLPEKKLVSRCPLRLEREGHAALYGFFLGVAALPKAILYARARWHARGLSGPLSEALVLLRLLGRLARGRVEGDPILSPQRIVWQVEGGDAESARAVLGFVTTLDRLILGMRPAAPADRLSALWLTTPYRGLGRIVVAMLRGSPLPAMAGMQLFPAKEMTLRLDSPYVLDGELFEPTGEVALWLSADLPIRFLVP